MLGLAMSRITSSTIALLTSVMLVWVANGLCFTLLALRMSVEGFNTTDIGVVTTGYFFGQLLGAVIFSRIIEQVGHVRAFAAFASLLSASVIGYVFHVDLVIWTLIRILHGMCIAGLLMVVESWLNGSVSNKGRGRLLALYTIIQSVSMSAGQQLLNLEEPTSFILFAVASVLFSLALLPLVLSRSVSVGEVIPSRLSLKELFQVSPLGVIGSFGSGALVSILIGLSPVYLRSIGFSVSQTALFMSVIILGGLIVQYVVGRASDVFDRRTVIATSLFLGGALCLIICLVPSLTFWFLAASTTIYSGIIFAIYPLSVAHANDFLEADDLVPASAGLIMAMAIGATVGPMITTIYMENFGTSEFFVMSGLICFTLCCFAVFRMSRRAAPEMADQGPYVLLSRTTAASVELDPRG
jgi:MFS family permease